MFRIQRKFVESCLLIMLLITLFLLASLSATAQEPPSSQVVLQTVQRNQTLYDWLGSTQFQ